MRTSREVQPNLGFLQQLATCDNKLRQQRYRSGNLSKDTGKVTSARIQLR
jgi:hypothetical protein